MPNSKEEPQVVAFLAEVHEVRSSIENACGMTMDELEQLAKESEMLTEAYSLFVKQAARKYGIDLPGLGLVPGRSVQ
ncbi:Uncharacterised protein [Burkholderia pseudomallei]|nr:Uncharacterised protein [Burkholderia pseudomallei]